jgi:ubiquinone/menaquinone biosynthesis C-methylase UbiE
MRFFRKSQVEHLAVSMPGVKLGDRILVAGCSDPKLLAALASKTGLTGRACAVDESAERSAEAARVALAEGALVETMSAPLASLPFDDASFDIVVLRDVLLEGAEGDRLLIVRETWRVLRPGGRAVVIQSAARSGIGKLLGGGATPALSDAAGVMRALQGAQFRGVRTLAERDGLSFVEGTKPA